MRESSTGDIARSRTSRTVDGERPSDPNDNSITSIIPIDEFGLEEYADGPLTQWRNASADGGRRRAGARRFDRDAYDAPRRAEITQDIIVAEVELDEILHDHPFEVRGAGFDGVATAADESTWSPRKQTSPRRSAGKHRITAPPQALKGRAALMAVAAGAAVAAATGQFTQPAAEPTTTAAPMPVVNPISTDEGLAAGIAAAPAPANMDTFTEQLAVGQELAKAAHAQDQAARIPLFAAPMPAGAYTFTSTYANRWGSFHGGIDLAAPLGTSIHAVTDGVVIEAGPASGYGNWVQIQAEDGTVTMYGHMSAGGVLVKKGDKITAGQKIAEVGSEGFSTGPHLHFEVWKNGTMKVDPAPWLAAHGISLASYTGS